MANESADYYRQQADRCRRIAGSLLNQDDPMVTNLLAMAVEFEAKVVALEAKSSNYSRGAKARWADPIIGEKIRTALRHPVRRAKVREATQARWADPEMRAQMIAAMRVAGVRRRGRKRGDT